MTGSPRDQLDAYHDGTLPPEDARRFEERVRQDPDLARTLRDAGAVDDALRRLFPLPDRAALLPARPGGRRLWRWGALAAAVLVLLSVVGAVLLRPEPAPRGLLTSAEVIYMHQKQKGFTPDWKCESDDEFAQVSRDRFGQALLLEPLPEGVEVLGWAYSGSAGHFVLSREEMLLIIRAGQDRVLAVIDRTDHDREVPLSGLARPPLHVFRARVGDLVVYELTPRATPILVDRLYSPDVPG